MKKSNKNYEKELNAWKRSGIYTRFSKVVEHFETNLPIWAKSASYAIHR